MDYLHNYCSLNRTAIDKILKKHDKVRGFQSRGTVMVVIKQLQFFKETELQQLQGFVEFQWKKVHYLNILNSSFMVRVHRMWYAS